MKKFYTLLTLCFAFLGIATATAQNAPELSNEKAYTVKNSRSAWVTSSEALKTIADLGLSEDAADANQQFAFLTNDEGETYYLYSVGQQKFINNDGTLSVTADYPVYFKKGNAEGTFVTYFENGNHINIGGSNQMAINSWSTADAGNSNQYFEVADFDATEALKALPAPVVPEFPCIKSLSELSNNKLYTVVQKNHSRGATSWAIAAGGEAFVSSKQVEGTVVGQADDTKQQFAFLTYEEQIYLYHPAEQKFVNKDATLSATPVDAITLMDGAYKNTFMAKFDDSHYVNVNGEQNMGIDGWSAADGGNSCTISAVADFDPTEVLKLFAPAEPEAATVVSVDPACGYIESGLPATIKITFSEDIKAVNQAMFQGAGGPMSMQMLTEENYTINGNEVTFNLGALVEGQPYMMFVAAVEDVNGNAVTYSYNPDEYEMDGYIVLNYTAPVKADLFAMESATPAAGATVEMLDVINVTFGNPNYAPMFPGQSQSVGGFDSSKEVVLLNAMGEVVTKASMEAVQKDGWNTNEVKFTLDTPVSIVGNYTLVIPAGTVYNEMYYEYAEDFGASNGAIYNPEVRLDYSVGTTIEINPALGEIPATTETITLTFSKDIQAVNVAILQSSMGELPALTEDDYFFWGNELSITLPTEYTAKMTDLTVILQVMDVDGNPVTFSNHEFYGKQDGMIFLSYTLAPVTPEIVEFSPALGAMDATEKSIYLSFNTKIAEVEVIQLQSSMGELPPLVENENYFVWDKDLSIVLPVEQTAKMSDLLLILKVKDIQGKYVTYSNFEQYSGTPDMVFLYYTLNPVTPELVNFGANTITSSTKSLELMFTTPIAEVETVVLQSSMGEFPPMVEGEGYSVYDNILTLNLPEEYLSKANDLTVVLKVKDVQGKYVTFCNHSVYPEQEGMIFLEYQVLPVTKVVSVSPECAKHDALPTEVVVTFDGDIKAVEYGTIRTNLTGFRGYIMSESDYVIEGNKLTINVPAEFVENQANMQIRMNVVDVNDMYVTYAFDPDYEWEDAIILEWSAPVKADLFNMVSVDPEEGEVAKLDVINVTFADAYETVIGGFDMSKVIVVLNAAGDTVTTATMEAVTDEYGWNTNVAKFTLETPVTEAGEYTFVIPAATVYNEMFYEWAEDFGVEQMGALYNAEVRIAYTVDAPTTIVSGYPALGEIPATTETLTLTFSKDIKEVNTLVLQSTMGELPALTEDDYFFWGNELSINLPIEYTSKMTDLTVILQVMDVEGNPVTFSNHEFFGTQEGMIFLSYTLAPVTPEIVEFSPALGAMDATERSIYLSFNTKIAEVEVIQLQSSMGELPPLVENENYFVWDKDLSIVLPVEQTAKMSDLLLILKVKDIQGKYVTYSNFEQYSGTPDMVFLYYTLNPVTPELVNFGANTITSSTKSLELMFTTPIAEVETVVLQSSMGEFPPMVEGEGYSVYDNILTLNLPEEYLSKANDLTVVLKVKDVQGKYVTFCNHSVYPEQEGMIFLEYQVLPVTKVVSVSPECAKHDALPTEVVVTFDGDIKAVEYGTIRTNLTGFRGYIMSESDYVIEGNKLTINVPAEFVENQANMQIRMNVVDVNDMYVTYAFDPDYEWEDAIILEWSAPVKADLFNMVSVDPEEGEVAKLDVINVTFADAYETVIGGFDMSKVIVVLNAAGDTVTTATMEAVTDEYGWNTNVAKFTLETPVTEAGEYTFVIPAATVYNEMFYEWAEDFGVEQMGALYNAEVRIAYTIVDPTGINNITVDGKNDIYTLDGRKVNKVTKSGVYVINGKKVYVK